MADETTKIKGEDIQTPEDLAAAINKKFAQYNDLLSQTTKKSEFKEMHAELILDIKELTGKLDTQNKEHSEVKKKLDEMTETLKVQGTSITTMKSAFNPKGNTITFKDAVLKALTEGRFNELADKKASNASFNVELKDIAFGASGFTGGAAYQAGAAIQAAMPFQLPVFTPEEDFDIRTAVPTGTTDNAKLDFPVERSYTDNMGALLENADSVESEITFTMSSMTSQRISTHITVSRSALRNVSWLANHISTRLMGKFVKYLNTQALTGVGTTVYMKGLTEYATTFTAGDLANTIPNASYVDVLIAARARNYQVNKIRPNVVFVNPLDAVVIASIKSTTGEWANKEPYVTVSASGLMSVMGMQIVESFDITAGTYLMVNVSSQNMELLFNGPIEILATDSEASNFLKNLVTIKLEAECMFPVYREGAIIKGTFAADQSAITVS